MRPCLALLPMLLATAPAWAAADTYRLDPVHTRVLFSIDHAGYSQAMGTVSGSEGRGLFDPDNWRDATLEVDIPVSRLDLGDAKWNQATLARSLLDGERFPSARFVSSRVEPIDAKRAHVIGTLTLRGVSQEVTMDVTLNAIKRYPLTPFRRTAGFSASTTLSRRLMPWLNPPTTRCATSPSTSPPWPAAPPDDTLVPASTAWRPTP